MHFVTLGGLFWCIYLPCIARARNAPVGGGQAHGEIHQNERRGPQDPENALVHFFQSPHPHPLKGGDEACTLPEICVGAVVWAPEEALGLRVLGNPGTQKRMSPLARTYN